MSKLLVQPGTKVELRISYEDLIVQPNFM